MLLVTRRPGAHRIQKHGVRIEDPSSGQVLAQRIAAVCGIEAAAEQIASQPVLFCMRSPDTAAAARALAARAPHATVAACKTTSTMRPARGELRARDQRSAACGRRARAPPQLTPPCMGSGRIVIGAWPSQDVPQIARFCNRRFCNRRTCRRAAPRRKRPESPQVLEDKWLKLTVSDMSAPERPDPARTTPRATSSRSRRARGSPRHPGRRIPARSCDGRITTGAGDRHTSAESLALRHQRARACRCTTRCGRRCAAAGRSRPIRYHRQARLALAAERGIAAPQNARACSRRWSARVREATRSGTAPAGRRGPASCDGLAADRPETLPRRGRRGLAVSVLPRRARASGRPSAGT